MTHYDTLIWCTIVLWKITQKVSFIPLLGSKTPVGFIADVEDNTQVTILGGFNIIFKSMSSLYSIKFRKIEADNSKQV